MTVAANESNTDFWKEIQKIKNAWHEQEVLINYWTVAASDKQPGFERNLKTKWKKFLTNRTAYDKLNKLSERQEQKFFWKYFQQEEQHLDK